MLGHGGYSSPIVASGNIGDDDKYSLLEDNSLGGAEAVPRRGESLSRGGGTPLGTLGGGRRDGLDFEARGHRNG